MVPVEDLIMLPSWAAIVSDPGIIFCQTETRERHTNTHSYLARARIGVTFAVLELSATRRIAFS